MTFADGYVDVATRIAEFYAKYPDGSLQMDPPKMETIEGTLFLVGRAYAYRTPTDDRPGIGHAWEMVPGRTPYTKGSELMVLETSAWGRALAALGIATKAGIASSDEVAAAESRRGDTPTGGMRGPAAKNLTGDATDKQIAAIVAMMRAQGLNEIAMATLCEADLGFEWPRDGVKALTKGQASAVIERMKQPSGVTRSKTPDPDDPWASPPLVDPFTGEVAG
jgi:hypothetical protein